MKKLFLMMMLIAPMIVNSASAQLTRGGLGVGTAPRGGMGVVPIIPSNHPKIFVSSTGKKYC